MLYQYLLLYILAVVLRGHLHPAYQPAIPPPEPYFIIGFCFYSVQSMQTSAYSSKYISSNLASYLSISRTHVMQTSAKRLFVAGTRIATDITDDDRIIAG